MNVILIAVISLGVIALVLAAILYVASKKFAVYEDPRIAQVAAVLPQANCGGCGYPGCSGFADACVKAGSLEGKLCPVGGQPVMAKVADIAGRKALSGWRTTGYGKGCRYSRFGRCRFRTDGGGSKM